MNRRERHTPSRGTLNRLLSGTVYGDVHRERLRAHTKHEARSLERASWTEQARWLRTVGEEHGEVCRALCDDEGPERLRAELVQLAAMTVAWIEAIDQEVDSG